jgi:antitoxin component YwqK of YwqJK toxin-antitoxin module
MTTPTNQHDPQGNRHGVWEHYQLDGRMWFRGRYIHGEPQGIWKWHYKDGTVDAKEYYITIK